MNTNFTKREFHMAIFLPLLSSERPLCKYTPHETRRHPFRRHAGI
jgi:hypothetical protein